MQLAVNAACVAAISGAVSQLAAALHGWTPSQLHAELITQSTAIPRLAFPPKDENESTSKDQSGFQNESDSLM